MMLPVSLCLLVLVVGTSLGARLSDFCPSGCSCDDTTLVVTCVDANLNVIPITLNPSIQRLVLKQNRIKTVHAAFQFYGRLQYVDLSYNHLVSIPQGSFDAQRQLMELHLNNNKISSLMNTTFTGLRKLTVLSLRENFLEEITERLFSQLPLLEELDLGQNRISRIDPAGFADLKALRVLYLDDNQLRAIPTPSFDHLGSLAELRVGLNAFVTLPDDAFKGLDRLTVLDLSGAGLLNISENAFRGLPGLKVLGLTDNRLKTIPTQQLAGLPRLEDLSIGQNEFTVVESNAFQGLTNLRRLDISGTPNLEKIEKGALSENLNLDTLVLSSNKRLAALEDGTLGGLPNLRHLVLRDNAFATFPESLTTWGELNKLDLAENPLDCHCGLVWLRDLLAVRNASQVLCAAPAHLKDRPLKALSADELGCALHHTRQQALIGALTGCSVAVLAVFVFFGVRYRRRLRDAVKDYKWNNRAISRKEHEYQKTFSDEDYIGRGSQHQQPMKPIPVTEL